jgi:uncharacterized membrane protein
MEEAKPPEQERKEGQDDRTMMLVAYILTWLTGLIVYFTAGKEDAEVRFHAVQAIIIGVAMLALWLLGVVTLIGWVVTGPVAILLWLYGLYVGYKAYSTGERVMVPYIGEYALKYSEKPPA